MILVEETFVDDAVVSAMDVPVAFVNVTPWNEDAPVTVSVVETVVGELNVIVEEFTNNLSALLY